MYNFPTTTTNAALWPYTTAGAPDELHIHHFDEHPSIIIIDAEEKKFETDSKNFMKSITLFTGPSDLLAVWLR